MKTLELFVRLTDAVNEFLGKAVSWFVPLLMLVTVYDVLMRYIFRATSVKFMDIETNLYILNFMLAAGWTLIHDGHVRVDLVYARLDQKKKAWINIFGSLVFCVPFCILVIWTSWPYVLDSWRVLEGSPDPGGLPGTFLIKTSIPVTFFLLGMQAVSQAIKNLFTVMGKEVKA
ncbi:MAG: TRAP transporter small permease subunit [Desulfomonilaceae bacterium]|nr:TRAP transporter small permease subunit [Desulfomonilaceae bacterium]